MTRASVTALLVACCATASLRAQQAPPPSLVVTHATHKDIAKAMSDILKPQKFKVLRASKGQIVISQDRGGVPQATGGVMRVRLEMVFALEHWGDSIRVTPVEEAYYGGGAAELKRTVELDKDRQNFETLFKAVHERLAATGAAPDTTAQ